MGKCYIVGADMIKSVHGGEQRCWKTDKGWVGTPAGPRVGGECPYAPKSVL